MGATVELQPVTRTHTATTSLLGAVLGVLLVAAGLLAPSVPAKAADADQWNAGMIIADEVFYASGTMSSAQVQQFLDSLGADCEPSASGVPCLKDFTESTISRVATEFCSAYVGAANEPASQIIWKSAQACGINPQAIITILQKEQGLVTASGATLTEDRYRSAMGFRCPTGLPCEPEYAGFSNQVYSAAARFQEYRKYPQRFNHLAGQDNVIAYHPNAACGSSTVFIRNQATAGLYNYTPYQPNQAALDAGYGVGDACSSYGNRNFWLRFREWFGPTEGDAYSPVGNFESLTGGPGELRLAGWALDPDTTEPIYLLVTIDGAGQYVYANRPRPDVEAVFPDAGPAHGFDAALPASAGTHRVCVTASNVGIGKHTSLGCREATVLGGSPFGNFESAGGVSDGIQIGGWAIDPDTTAPIYLWVTVDGVGQHVLANRDRPDLASVFPAYGSAHGFAATIPASLGTHRVCATASNVGAGSHTPLGCRTVDVVDRSPVGNFEQAVGVPGGVEIAGWAIDPDTPDPIYLWVTVDGIGEHVYADRNRPDVGAVFPASGPNHGFQSVIAANPGSRTVCITASNVGPGSHRSLGCRTATIP